MKENKYICVLDTVLINIPELGIIKGLVVDITPIGHGAVHHYWVAVKKEYLGINELSSFTTGGEYLKIKHTTTSQEILKRHLKVDDLADVVLRPCILSELTLTTSSRFSHTIQYSVEELTQQLNDQL